jgi:hypothetical protein
MKCGFCDGRGELATGERGGDSTECWKCGGSGKVPDSPPPLPFDPDPKAPIIDIPITFEDIQRLAQDQRFAREAANLPPFQLGTPEPLPSAFRRVLEDRLLGATATQDELLKLHTWERLQLRQIVTALFEMEPRAGTSTCLFCRASLHTPQCIWQATQDFMREYRARSQKWLEENGASAPVEKGAAVLDLNEERRKRGR